MGNPLKAKLAAGGCITCQWMVLGSPSIAELMAQSGADAVVFDQQHGLWPRPVLEHGIGLARPFTVPVVRTTDDSYHAIGSALDAGARAIIVPMVETAEQARAVVKAAKYPPLGGRSVGGPRPIFDYKTYVPAANADIMVAAMIETEEGVRNASAIARVDGIDMLFVGPFDLSLSLGTFPEFGPKHEAAVQSVRVSARGAGKPCGIFTIYATVAQERRVQGFQWVVLADDQTLIQGQAKGAVNRVRMAEGPDLVTDRVALVTGANGGIGSEICRALLGAGVKKIYCTARSPEKLASLVKTAPDRFVPVKLDVTSQADIDAAAKQCGDVALLVNVAGLNKRAGHFAAESFENARQEMAVNYFGTFAVSRAFQPVLKKNGGGAIVNIISAVAMMHLPLMGTYSVSKAALLSLTQGLRAELKGQGTHVMAVLPGAVDTPMEPGFEGMKMSPQAVADALVHGLRSRSEDIYPGAMASGVAFGATIDIKAVEDQFSAYLPDDRS